MSDAKKSNPNIKPELESQYNQAPINTVPAVVLIATPILALFLVPWYLWTHSVGLGTWAVFAFLMAWTGMGITAGYHRLFAHKAYKAHPIIQNFLLIGGTLAVESSVFDWCSGHRRHHRFVDDEYKDPYSARRGFWFSHIGWMLRNYPSGQHDFKNIPDLTKQKLLRHQHKHYGAWIIVTNTVILLSFGWLVGDILGVFVLAGLLRLVLTHHFTFFINSLCHMFGTRPYTDTNTARDNFILAIFTWGEGYHNYHHFFQYDYRNGVKWWQYDPTKWLILVCSKLGLAKNLRKVDEATIRHAQVQMQFKKVNSRLEKLGMQGFNIHADFKAFKDKITAEYDSFNATIAEWQALKAKVVEMKKTEFAERLNEVDELMRAQFQSIESKIMEHGKSLDMTLRQLKQISV
ncbi:fatty acid desaturase [Psychrobacter sp. HD31]|uniref:acyl-CoA desaturase n=1 Tax=Psychrobacter sp. HD31 TaxID=3112003 RepID=UPI003DA6620A